MSEQVKYVAGHIVISDQMLEQVLSVERAYAELQWIATHWDEATPEQRAQFESFEEAQRRREDEGW